MLRRAGARRILQRQWWINHTQWSPSYSLRLLSIFLFQFVRVAFYISFIRRFIISSRSPVTPKTLYVFVGCFSFCFALSCALERPERQTKIREKWTKTFIWPNVLFFFVGPSTCVLVTEGQWHHSQFVHATPFTLIYSWIDRCIEPNELDEARATRWNILTNDLFVT